MLRAVLVALAPALLLGACAGSGSGGPPPPITAGPRLEPVGDRAIGLGYGEMRALRVRYLDRYGSAVAGVTVRYALSGDTGGATLSADRAATGGDGVASITLTAGAAEASFHLTASAADVDEVDFEIAVSRLPFVTIEARLAYTEAGTGQVARLQALLYDDRSCSALTPSLKPSSPLPRQLSGPGPTGSFQFPFLRTIGYALVGRALDANGHLLGWNCVDLDVTQFGGGTVTVLVPLRPLVPSPLGAYRLKTNLPLQPGQLPAWDALSACAAAPAQQLLDALAVTLGPGTVADGIAKQRLPADAQGCRPAGNEGIITLDGSLALLLQVDNPTLTALQAAVTDLQAVTASATITSRLTVTPAGAGGDDSYLASHVLELVGFAGANGAHPVGYDPVALGLPLPWADDVVVAPVAGGLRIGRHGFTLRLPALWGRALTDVALAPRQLPADPRALLGLVVGSAARRSGDRLYVGCSAVEDLILERVAATRGSIAPACERALDAMAAELAAAFVPAAGLDFTLEGNAMLGDDDGDLLIDSMAGAFTAGLVVSGGQPAKAEATFAGARLP